MTDFVIFTNKHTQFDPPKTRPSVNTKIAELLQTVTPSLQIISRRHVMVSQVAAALSRAVAITREHDHHGRGSANAGAPMETFAITGGSIH